MSPPRLQRPEGHADSVFVVSCSGGKDSTALILAMREAEIPALYVFADTGWEVPQTYEHLDMLELRLGISITRVGKPGGMIGQMELARFPSRMQRWCTQELKIEPLREYHNAVEVRTGLDTVCAVGIRAEESPARARLPLFEHDPEWGGYVWRPLLHWTVQDVLEIHHRHDVPVNALYRLGFDRVGCMPCVYADKEDIRLLAQHFPERVDLLRQLEKNAAVMREERNRETPGRHKSTDAAFFLARDGKGGIMHIDEAVVWSRTVRGGKQLPMFPEEPRGGCMRWGLCDGPSPRTVPEGDPKP